MLPLNGPGGSYATPMMVVYSGPGVAVPQTFLGSTFHSPVVLFGNSPTFTVTASQGSSSFAIVPNNGRVLRSEEVAFSSTGSLPSPLQQGIRYKILSPGATSFEVADPVIGTAITMTSAGSGTLSATFYTSDLGLPPLTARGLDSGMPTWAGVNTASGVYSWSVFDAYVDYHARQRGRKLLFCFNQTPTWAARNSALDAYGYAGGGQVPSDLTTGATYITQVLSRYNQVSDFNPEGSKFIWGVEIWNEPSFSATGTTSANWCGTLGELSQFARLIYQAVKAVDPSVLVLGPGFTTAKASVPVGSTTTGMYNWLITSDGLGGFARQWIDGVSYHGYDTSLTSLPVLPAQIRYYRSLVQASGLPADFPLYQTERGVDTSNPPTHFLRTACIEAALQVKLSVQYTTDTYGNNPRNSSELRDAMARFYTNVCGKTITLCVINPDYSVSVTVDGTVHTF